MIKPGIELPENGLTRLIIVLFSLLILTELSSCGGDSSTEAKPSLSINSPSVTEGDADTAELIFTITLSEDAASTLTVDYSTTAGSATESDGDFTAVNGQLVITAGSRTASVSVFANGDTVFEQNESFNLVISNPQGLALRENSITGIGTIDNDDDAEPKGYFSGTGTLNGQNLTDLTGLMYNNRLMMFSPSQNVLYDIALTITLDTYTATAGVYKNGDITDSGSLANVSLSGTTDENSISGSFSGSSGLGDGSFTLNFDQNNNIGATINRIVVTGTLADRWAGDIYGVEVSPDVGRFNPSSNMNAYTGTDQGSPGCGYAGNLVIPDADVNIYQLAHDVVTIGGCLWESAGHTGFASVVVINNIDILVYAFANDDFGFFAIMEKF